MIRIKMDRKGNKKKKALIVLGAILALSVFAMVIPANAAVIYVDATSETMTTGSTTPIQDAVDAASPGEIRSSCAISCSISRLAPTPKIATWRT